MKNSPDNNSGPDDLLEEEEQIHSLFELLRTKTKHQFQDISGDVLDSVASYIDSQRKSSPPASSVFSGVFFQFANILTNWFASDDEESEDE